MPSDNMETNVEPRYRRGNAEKREPRILTPDAPVEEQVATLQSLIKSPPQRSVVQTFSPELAEWILTNINSHNRRRKPAKVKLYAADMQAGEWGLTGQTVIFGDDGKLLDGQNRLAASVLSETPFISHVVFGVDRNTFDIIDIGATRRNPDAFRIAAVANPDVTARACRWLWIYAQRPDDKPPNRAVTTQNKALLRYYHDKVNDTLLQECIHRARKFKAVPVASLAAHLYLFHAVEAYKSVTFAEELDRQGVRHPLAKVLKRHMDRNFGRMDETHRNALLILAWNAKREERRLIMEDLKWLPDDDYPEYGA